MNKPRYRHSRLTFFALLLLAFALTSCKSSKDKEAQPQSKEAPQQSAPQDVEEELAKEGQGDIRDSVPPMGLPPLQKVAPEEIPQPTKDAAQHLEQDTEQFASMSPEQQRWAHFRLERLANPATFVYCLPGLPPPQPCRTTFELNGVITDLDMCKLDERGLVTALSKSETEFIKVENTLDDQGRLLQVRVRDGILSNEYRYLGETEVRAAEFNPLMQWLTLYRYQEGRLVGKIDASSTAPNIELALSLFSLTETPYEHTTYVYNETGQLIRELCSCVNTPSCSCIPQSDYRFEGDHVLNRVDILNDEPIAEDIYTWEEGLLVRQETMVGDPPANTVHTFKHDDQGRLIETLQASPDRELKSTYRYECE